MQSEHDIELLKLKFEEFKYRHELFWKLFFSFSLAILFLLALPYAYPDKVAEFKRLIIFLPLAAAIVTVFCYWLLSAEYQRLASVRRQLTDLTPESYKPYPLATHTKFAKLLNRPVGQVVVNVFFVGFLTLAVLEGLFIYYAAKPSVSPEREQTASPSVPAPVNWLVRQAQECSVHSPYSHARVAKRAFHLRCPLMHALLVDLDLSGSRNLSRDLGTNDRCHHCRRSISITAVGRNSGIGSSDSVFGPVGTSVTRGDIMICRNRSDVLPNPRFDTDPNLPPKSLTRWANGSEVSNGKIWSEKDESV